ncbi:MAG: AAA family ATPase [Patescibacteria group bacterium]
MAKIILGLVGEIASGKDVTKKYLEDNYGANCHRFSTILRDLLSRLYMPITRENMQNISTILRQQFGGDLLAKIITEDVKNDPHEIVVVDGIRRAADMVYLKTLPSFHLVSIEVDSKIRYERLVKRNENADDATKTYGQFLADGKKETELEIPEVMSNANYKLDNNGSLKDLYNQIEKLIIDLEK